MRIPWLLVLTGCPLVTDATGDGAGEATETDAVTDADTDADTDPDAEADTDTDADTDAEPEPRFGAEIIGGDRPVEVIVPRGYDGVEPLPLVVLLHGYGSDGARTDAWLGLSERVDADRFFLLVPDGTRDAAGRRYWNWYLPGGADDERYLLDLIDEMEREWRVDPDRVVLVGHSNGGFMSYRMACRHGDRLAGIVSIAGLSPPADLDCTPPAPVSLLHIHGTLDAVVPYLGGTYGRGAPALAGGWAARAGCATDPEPSGRMDRAALLPGDETIVEVFPDCLADREVRLWTIEGGSHVPQWTAGTNTAILDTALDWRHDD